MLLHTQACKHWYKKIIYCFYALLLHWGANFKPQTTLRTWPFLGNWRLSADLNSAWLQYFYCGQGAETTCSLQSRLLRDNLFIWKDFVRYFPHTWKTLRCKLVTVQCLRPAYINFGTCLRNQPSVLIQEMNQHYMLQRLLLRWRWQNALCLGFPDISCRVHAAIPERE